MPCITVIDTRALMERWKVLLQEKCGGPYWYFPGMSGISRISGISGISPGFWGENSGVFSWFQAVTAYKPLQNDHFSGDDFRDFPEFPEFPENFRKIPEFRNFGNPKNSRNFRKFPATGFFRKFLYFFIIYALYRRVRGYKKL
jgi:hypothetical protein